MGLPYTDEDRKLIKMLLNEGKTIRQIGSILNRSFYSIHTEICRHGGVEFYQEKKESKNKRNILQTVNNRISALEMQIELIFNLLKEIKHAKD